MKTKTQPHAIRLLEQKTIELLKMTLEEPPVCRMEELLHLAYINEALRQVRLEQIIVDLQGGNDEKIKEILRRQDEGTVRKPCVVEVNGHAYVALLETSRNDNIPLSLSILDFVLLFF